jgi:hypothetical protein
MQDPRTVFIIQANLNRGSDNVSCIVAMMDAAKVPLSQAMFHCERCHTGSTLHGETGFIQPIYQVAYLERAMLSSIKQETHLSCPGRSRNSLSIVAELGPELDH